MKERNTELYLVSVDDTGHFCYQRFAELVRQDAYGLPTIEDASQHWAKVDGAVAWHLIERHADNWADVGKMMDEFVAVRVRIEREACAKLCDEFDDDVGQAISKAIRGRTE